MKSLAGALAILMLLLAVGLLYVYSGWYNIAASQPHSGPLHWLLDTTKEQSVKAHAADIRMSFPDSSLLQSGARSYRAMCQQCHGAPGVVRSEMSKGLNPAPPDLARTAAKWSPAEVFWILKHGIKMTGMPAWGQTHSDDQLWEIVAFVRKLPDISPEEYDRMTGGAASDAKPHEHHDHHP